jgi:hypothetical protein
MHERGRRPATLLVRHRRVLAPLDVYPLVGVHLHCDKPSVSETLMSARVGGYEM